MKVPLRIYNREIEGMIEGGRNDEAIAHCLHILKTYPMHVDTYRLLGKAFLESRKYADAADILMRVLASVPDDFVAHVGMSIIRDDGGNLDEAIWHMERAYEVQPSNPAIQGELRRLYGRRDGIEPPKVRLTRDALANMYLQGELYNQAIAEVRSVLAEDPNRADLQIMLARAYYRAGQKVEATEMCMALIKKYPYCLDALRILTEILPGTGRSEDTQVYRQRIQFLDPYASFSAGSMFKSSEVPDNKVNLERLEYVQGAGIPVKSEWTEALGIKIEPDATEVNPPEWLEVSTAGDEQTSSITEPPPSSESTSSSEGEIPDWMRSAGWKETSSEDQESSGVVGDMESIEPIEKGEIPDWLKSMAPSEEKQVAPFISDSSEPVSVETPASDEQFPEWLKDLKSTVEEPTPRTAPYEAPQMQSLTPEEEPPTVPVEKVVLDSESAPPSTDDQDAALAWLEGLAAKQGAKSEELITKPEERSEVPPVWVQEETETQPEELVQPTSSEESDVEVVTPKSESDTDVLSWLEDLSGESESKADETIESLPEEEIAASVDVENVEAIPEREEIPPETGEEVSPAEPVVFESVQPEVEEKTPDELVDEQPQVVPETEAAEPIMKDEEVLELVDQDKDVKAESGELPEWLREFENPSLQKPDDQEIPEWLRDHLSAKTEGAPELEIEPKEDIGKPEEPASTKPEEWLPAAVEDEKAALSSADVSAPESKPSIKPSTGELSKVPSQEKDADILISAQNALQKSRLDESMAEYGRLIKKGRLIDEVIHDLREAIYRFPVDIIVWQTLGDAYNKANRIQDAIDAYTQAEELLR